MARISGFELLRHNHLVCENRMMFCCNMHEKFQSECLLMMMIISLGIISLEINDFTQLPDMLSCKR